MTSETASPLERVRVTAPFKARSVDTGDSAWFPQGAVLWHVEIGEEFAQFMEIGGRGVYEIPKYEFTPCVKKLSR
jgi:hypothetical protein